MNDFEPTQAQREALERLIEIALGHTGGQARRVADFLLSWWNAGECGGFDMTASWGLDTSITADLVTVFGLIAAHNAYPDDYGYGSEFQRIVAAWRAELLKGGA